MPASARISMASPRGVCRLWASAVTAAAGRWSGQHRKRAAGGREPEGRPAALAEVGDERRDVLPQGGVEGEHRGADLAWLAAAQRLGLVGAGAALDEPEALGVSLPHGRVEGEREVHAA